MTDNKPTPLDKLTQPKQSKVKAFLKKLRPYKPYINAWLDIGFFSFHTEVMHSAFEMYAYKYIEVSWKFFKWGGHFTLYKPGEDFKKR